VRKRLAETAKKVVFRLTIYEDGSFEASTEGKELKKGKFTAMDSLMGAMVLLMAGATVAKKGKIRLTGS